MQPVEYAMSAHLAAGQLQRYAAPGAQTVPAGLYSSSPAMQYPALSSSPGMAPCGLPAAAGNVAGGITGARNPFAAMPRELRNSQLRSNLLAVAGAFSSCNTGASPPTNRDHLAHAQQQQQQQPQKQQQQQLQWPPSVLSTSCGVGAAVPPPPPQPATYQPASSSGSSVYGSQQPVAAMSAPLGLAYPNRAPQQTYAVAGNPLPLAVTTGLPAGSSYTAPLPLLHQQQQFSGTCAAYSSDLTYQQQQQQQLAAGRPQQLVGQQYAGLYSDPLPYQGGVTSVAPEAVPRQQQQQLVYSSQGVPVSMPCSAMMALDPPGLSYTAARQPPPPPPPHPAAAAAVAPGSNEHLNHVQQLLQKQQALQALEQMVQQQLLKLLPDA